MIMQLTRPFWQLAGMGVFLCIKTDIIGINTGKGVVK